MDSTFVLTEPILPTKPTKLVLPSAKDSKGSEIGNSAPGLTLLKYYDVNKHVSNIAQRSVSSAAASVTETGHVLEERCHPPQVSATHTNQVVTSSTPPAGPSNPALGLRVNGESIGTVCPMTRQKRRVRDSNIVINVFETTSPRRLTAPPGSEFFPSLENGDFFLNAIGPSPSDVDCQFQVWIFEMKDGQGSWKPLAWGDLVNGRHVVITKKGNDISLIAPTTFQKRYKEARIVV